MGIPKCVKASMAFWGWWCWVCSERVWWVVVTRGRVLQLPCMLRTVLLSKGQTSHIRLLAIGTHTAKPAAAGGGLSSADPGDSTATAGDTGFPTCTLGRLEGLHKASWQRTCLSAVRCCWVLQYSSWLRDRHSWSHCGCCCCLHSPI